MTGHTIRDLNSIFASLLCGKRFSKTTQYAEINDFENSLFSNAISDEDIRYQPYPTTKGTMTCYFNGFQVI